MMHQYPKQEDTLHFSPLVSGDRTLKKGCRESMTLDTFSMLFKSIFSYF